MESGVAVEILNQWFYASETETIESRSQSEVDRDYFDGKQLTEEEAAELDKRGQPNIVTNRVRRKINWLKGNEMRNRVDPKGIPNSRVNARSAEDISKGITSVLRKSDYTTIRSDVWENMLIEGYGGVEILHRMGKEGVEIVLNHYSWDRLFYDPASKKPDFTDAKYKGAVIWEDIEDVSLAYPDVDSGAMMTGVENSSWSDTYDDRPRDSLWLSDDRSRIRLVLMWYYHKAKWYYALFTGSTILESGESPYLDHEGKTECGLHMQSLYVDRDNKRYGVIRDMRGPQDEINKRRSKALHALSNKQTIGEKGAIDYTPHQLSFLKSRPDGHIEVNPGMRFEFTDRDVDIGRSQLVLMQEAKSEIDLMGANAALAGDDDSRSGRALLARQNGGAIELTPDIDRLYKFDIRVFKAIYNRMRQFWNAEKWVSVLGDDGVSQRVGFNVPVTIEQALKEMPPDRRQFAIQNFGYQEGDPRLQQVVAVRNDLKKLYIDLDITITPMMIDLPIEVFQQLVAMDSADPGSVPKDLLIEAAPLPQSFKDRLIQHLRQREAQRTEIQNMQSGIAAERQSAEAGKMESESLFNRARAMKALVEAGIDGAASASGVPSTRDKGELT